MYQLCRLCTGQALLTHFWSPAGRVCPKLQDTRKNKTAIQKPKCFYQDCQTAWGSWAHCDCLLTLSLGSPHCLIPATHQSFLIFEPFVIDEKNVWIFSHISLATNTFRPGRVIDRGRISDMFSLSSNLNKWEDRLIWEEWQSGKPLILRYVLFDRYTSNS